MAKKKAVKAPKNLSELSARLKEVFPFYVEILDDGSEDKQLVIYTGMKVSPSKTDPERLEVLK